MTRPASEPDDVDGSGGSDANKAAGGGHDLAGDATAAMQLVAVSEAYQRCVSAVRISALDGTELDREWRPSAGQARAARGQLTEQSDELLSDIRLPSSARSALQALRLRSRLFRAPTAKGASPDSGLDSAMRALHSRESLPF